MPDVLQAVTISVRCRVAVDLAGGCGTMVPRMSQPRWLRLLLLVAFVAFVGLGTTEGHAQVFKPRTGKAAAPVKPAPAAVARKAAPAAVAAKKPTRTAGPAPKRNAPAKKRPSKKPADDDTVVVDDEDEPDVKITDD